MNTITIKPRIHTCGKYLKATWYVTGMGDITSRELADEVLAGAKIEVDMDVYQGKYVGKLDPSNILMNLLKRMEEHKGSLDMSLTRRILNHGGLIKYVQHLEAQK